MQRFYAILTQPVLGQPVGTLVNVTAGVDDFAGLWLVLEPPDLAGQRLVPLLDADRAITLKEAAHILGMRRGQSRAMNKDTVKRYLAQGLLTPATKMSGRNGLQWFISREATMKMRFPPRRGAPIGNRYAARKKKAPKGDEND